jgi:nucleotide-binding universal stress UspA family protein
MSGVFKKILIATDGSQQSLAAAKEGIDIARFHGSTLYALYVIDTGALDVNSGMLEPANLYQVLEQEGKSAVEQVRKAAVGLQVETFVLQGHPSEVIVGFANENGVDLLVMGTLGKRGIEKLLLGSVAAKVIRTAGCPVLVVKG